MLILYILLPASVAPRRYLGEKLDVNYILIRVCLLLIFTNISYGIISLLFTAIGARHAVILAEASLYFGEAQVLIAHVTPFSSILHTYSYSCEFIQITNDFSSASSCLRFVRIKQANVASA